MRRIFRPKILLIGLLAAAVAAGVALAVRACRGMGPEEMRACLGENLGRGTSEEQVEESAVEITAKLDERAEEAEVDAVPEEVLT
jgi:hypothetical protein